MTSPAPAPARAARLSRLRDPGVWRDDGTDLMELLLISAVATVLVVRAFLAAAGYPQLGGDGLHIAHVLWGGLLMLLGALVLLLRLDRPAVHVGALAAGIGFGLFIDEVGKFVTADVDYFYRPAIAIIYVTFMALALALVGLRRVLRQSPRGALANALALADEAISHPAAAGTRRRVLELLDRSDPADPLVAALRERVTAAGTLAQRAPGRLVRWMRAVEAAYRRLALTRRFQAALVILFAAIAASNLFATVAMVADAFGVGPRNRGTSPTLQVASATVGAVLILIGILRLRRSRLEAYRWFRRAILLNILVTQVFNFYDSQLTAVLGLAGSLLVYAALRYAIAREHELEADRARDAGEPAPA